MNTNNYIAFPKINPILISIGSINIYWYGLMYIISFIFILYMAKYKINHKNKELKINEIDNLIYIGFLGALIGGRIGYILFYNPIFFIHHPINIFKIWHGGMSFHGGLIGVVCSLLWYAKKYKKSFLKLTDYIAPLIPFGLCMGRIGNFINGELWGRVTLNTPWAMLFPNSIYEDIKLAKNNIILMPILEKYGVLPRHPSQLYEMIFEGIILFIILNIVSSKSTSITGNISTLFLIIYGIFRIIIEFFREPDPQLGFFCYLTMGQLLSIPMIVIGIIFYYYINKYNK